MKRDISQLIKGWAHTPNQGLCVRKVEGVDGRDMVQIRVELGLMQLEWTGRPDAHQPFGYRSLLDYYQDRRLGQEDKERQKGFTLSRQDCQALTREAVQYYWRRMSFFELKEYERAEKDAEHNLAILSLCQECAESEDDRQMAGQYRVYVMTHRIQARALARVERNEYGRALGIIREGIEEVETYLTAQEQPADIDDIGDCPELVFLRELEDEVRQAQPLSTVEQLQAELSEAVEQEQFELAAELRDRLRRLDAET